MGQLPEGALVRVTLELRVPLAATAEQVEEWLRYRLGDTCSCSNSNPLLGHDAETWGPSGFDWTETKRTGRREEFDHEETETGRRYRVRYIRERY